MIPPMANILVIMAIALGVVMVVDAIILPMIEAEGRGCKSGVPFNASQGRCFHP
jgi:hypothetical protein